MIGPIKVAVVGTGAAGLGALKALIGKQSNIEITVFDVGKPISREPPDYDASPEWIAEFYDELYRAIYDGHTFKFPPPKTHFGGDIPRYFLHGQSGLFKSESLGGLTNYWGGTILPFTERELSSWPFSLDVLEPYYREMADIIGISGKNDGLSEYFLRDYSNLPPIRLTPMLSLLNDVVNSEADSGGEYRLVSGVNRCTLETRESLPNSCVYCGECLVGCFAGSVYSTRNTIEAWLEDNKITSLVRGRVLAVDSERGALRVRLTRNREGNRAGNREDPANRNSGFSDVDGSDGIEQTFSGFSKIFLCAGCPGTTEIVMRSQGLDEVSEMADNAVYVFPIIYKGLKSAKDRHDSYLSLSNLIFGCIPFAEDNSFAQVQVYPNFDYLWRYNIPPRLWRLFRPLSGILRRRLFWGRLYVNGKDSPSYKACLKDDSMVFETAGSANEKCVPALMSSIRKAVNREGFWIPFSKPILQKINSHYASTLPYGGKVVDVPSSGEIMPNVYLCDSACFPDLPAVSLTFTIMANACRTAAGAMAS